MSDPARKTASVEPTWDRARIVDEASRSAAESFKARCSHVLSCKCWGKRRMMAASALYDLIDTGWQIIPPSASDGDKRD